MLIQYAYIRPRSQFGKQCFFEETDPIVEENILPNPELMRDYIHRSRCHRGVQKSEQFALHEMQTARKTTKETGMLHSEGGWPREINAKDEEAVQRFRRRVEKDENWAPRMRKLADPMERCVKQNNAVNIYENYFDETVPTALMLSRDIRTSNVFADPQPVVRPVSHLSWSPSEQNRLAASYSFTEFETQSPDVNTDSYIWDIENPNAPVICLRSPSPLMTIEFNPHDPSLLISGLMSGQVCNWDVRIGNRPVQMSHRQFSHRNPANQALWITSKTNTEFFSASIDGTIKWWDIRRLKQPIDALVMDLDEPLRADDVRAIGVATLQFEPTMGSKFMAGMENGLVISVNRRAASPMEKLAMRFNCHIGPVVAIDRNPFALKNFLTVGDWTAKIWAEDTKEGNLIVTRSRYSVFFTINVTGLLEVYDVLSGVDAPVTRVHVCNQRLTAIAPHENGHLLAVGSHDGGVYLVECSEGHTVNARTDKANFTAHLERCSRFEKAVDARLKEMRLIQASAREDPIADRAVAVSKGRAKKGDNKDRGRSRAQVKEKGELARRRYRPRRIGRDDADDVELAEPEAEYLRAVEQEFANYPGLEEVDAERVSNLMQEMSRKKKRPETWKLEEETVAREQREFTAVKADRATRATKPESPARSPARSPVRQAEIVAEEEAIAWPSARSTETATERSRVRKIRSKVCAVEVCKPEICCADMEEKRKARLQAELVPKRRESSRDVTRTLSTSRELSDLVQKLPERSVVWKRGVSPVQGESLANVLANEVVEARREVRAWQKRVVSGKRDPWRHRRTSEIVHEKPEGKKGVGSGDVESPMRDAVEKRSDFRQLAETSSRRGSGSEGEGNEAARTRGKRKARQLDRHLKKRTRESEMRPTSSACTSGDATDTTTRTTAVTIATSTTTTTTTMIETTAATSQRD